MVISAIILSIIGFICYLVALNFAFDEWSRDITVEKGENLVTTILGDEFLLQYKTTQFLELQTHLNIIDKTTNKKIVGVLITGRYTQPSVDVQINTQHVRCYELLKELLLYKVDDGSFDGKYIDGIEDIKVEGNEDLIEVSRALVAKKEWRWVKACGSFLLKAGDHDMRELLERYASGQFTQEELELNKNSEIKKEDIMAFSKQMLEQNNKPE